MPGAVPRFVLSSSRPWSYRRLKANWEEHLTKYAGSTDEHEKKAEKIGRANGKRVCGQAEKAIPIIENDKQSRTIAVCERLILMLKMF